ncbi:MAG: ribbon-helix-helix domain-containing protein [Fervidicoccaceae archaeon]
MVGRCVVLSCKVPRELVEALDELVEEGVFASRSDAVRRALGSLILERRAARRDEPPEILLEGDR